MLEIYLCYKIMLTKLVYKVVIKFTCLYKTRGQGPNQY